jgi:Skp family chaperone for outer membrane proteins
MNRMMFAAATTLAAGVFAVTAVAQGPAAAHAAVTPEAVPAKIAVIAFEQAVVATNEGQRSVSEIQKKYEPQKAKIDAEAKEVDALKAQIQALPASAPDDQRAKLAKDIDAKEKQLQLDADNAQQSYQDDLQKAYGAVAQKVGSAAVKYCQEHGYSLLLNVGGNQQAPNPVLWFEQKTDVTQAVVTAYNETSGIAAPTPSAPRPTTHPATHK